MDIKNTLSELAAYKSQLFAKMHAIEDAIVAIDALTVIEDDAKPDKNATTRFVKDSNPWQAADDPIFFNHKLLAKRTTVTKRAYKKKASYWKNVAKNRAKLRK